MPSGDNSASAWAESHLSGRAPRLAHFVIPTETFSYGVIPSGVCGATNLPSLLVWQRHAASPRGGGLVAATFWWVSCLAVAVAGLQTGAIWVC